ncbi:hypothetical protein LOK49_LG03G02568 [Camellia lanceoleosa]|uniref:Uncharacterized protein n=1 Tax=Camellia lanceoleosa TaxID=1840588 RepID=A0ACC0IDI2_9ERIC|nr:hypothetical protein LOK49_LG03G02568 [Camellia lanceoleosa]
MESRRYTKVNILFKAVLKEILEKFNLKLAIHSIEKIGRNHKPAFIASVDKKKKFYGTENSTKQGAKKEVAMMGIKRLNNQSELANVKADNKKLHKDYDKLSAENEELKKQLKNAITQSEKSTDMLSEDLNTDLPRIIASALRSKLGLKIFNFRKMTSADTRRYFGGQLCFACLEKEELLRISYFSPFSFTVSFVIDVIPFVKDLNTTTAL